MSRKGSFGFWYGTNDSLVCLTPSNIPLPGGKGSGCYAAKVSTYWLGLPLRKSVDHYVIAAGDTYYDLKGNGVSLLQSAGLLSRPSPVYRLSTLDTLWGHSLGIVVVLAALCSIIYKLLPVAARGRVDALVKAPIVTEGDLMGMLASDYFDVARKASGAPGTVLVVDPSFPRLIRPVSIDNISVELAAPGFPEEELDENLIAKIRSVKAECIRLTRVGEVNPDTSPYVNAVVIVRVGNKPLVKIIRSVRVRVRS